MSSLGLSPTFAKSSKAVISTSIPGQAYVLSLAPLPSYIAASASAPSNAIYLLDKADLKRVVHTLPGHTIGTTSIRTAGCFWTGAVGVQMGTSRALLSCDVASDGWLVAAGTELKGEDALLLYWDVRHPVAPLRSHASTHSDDITSVRFSLDTSKGKGENILLSASSDGLLSVSNANEDDEDEAVTGVGNWGCSISKAGWTDGYAWAASDMETLSIWNPEFDRILDVNRDRLNYPNTDMAWVTDYIIDCHTTPDGAFHLLVGSNEGDLGLLKSSQPFTQSTQWSLERIFSSQHNGVVRSVLWDDANGVILSGGEDSLINAWSCPYRSTSEESMDVDMTPRKRGYENSDSDIKRSRRF